MSWKAISSGILTSSQTVYSGPCFYFGFTCKPGAAAFEVVIFDNTAASGTAVEDYLTDAAKAMESHFYPSPVTCRNGLYLSLGGGSAIVYYTPLREGVQ